jgi:hypothetical protein
MSYNPNNVFTRDEYIRAKKLEKAAAWYNPSTKPERVDGVTLRPQTIYLGEKNEKPTWEEPVFDVATHRQHLSLIRQGKIDDDRLRFGAYLGDWDDVANEHADYLRYGRTAYNQFRSAAAGVIQSADSPAINVIQILGEILGQDNRNYAMEQAVTRVATPNLTLSVDSFHGTTASQDVAEGQEPHPKKGRFTRQTFTLKKDAGYVMQTDEASFIADRDVMNTSIQAVSRDLLRIKNNKIVTRLEGADVPTIAGSDWLAITGDHRTADPISEIGAAVDVISANGGTVDAIASDPKPWREYSINVQGGMNLNNGPVALTTSTNGVAGQVAGIGGVTWYIDTALADTRVTVYDKSTVLLMQGPVRTAQFRDERRGLDAYITRDWNAVQILDTSVIRGVTGVTT